MTTLHIVNEEGYKALSNLASDKPQIFTNPQGYNLRELMILEAETDDVWKQTLDLQDDLLSINSEETAGHNTDAIHARTLRKAMPHITAADAIDGQSLGLHELLRIRQLRPHKVEHKQQPQEQSS